MKDCYSIAVCDDEKLALDVVSSAVKSLMSKYSVTGGVFWKEPKRKLST